MGRIQKCGCSSVDAAPKVSARSHLGPTYVSIMLPEQCSYLLNNIRPAVNVVQGAGPVVQHHIVDHLYVLQGPPDGLAALSETAKTHSMHSKTTVVTQPSYKRKLAVPDWTALCGPVHCSDCTCHPIANTSVKHACVTHAGLLKTQNQDQKSQVDLISSIHGQPTQQQAGKPTQPNPHPPAAVDVLPHPNSSHCAEPGALLWVKPGSSQLQARQATCH